MKKAVKFLGVMGITTVLLLGNAGIVYAEENYENFELKEDANREKPVDESSSSGTGEKNTYREINYDVPSLADDVTDSDILKTQAAGLPSRYSSSCLFDSGNNYVTGIKDQENSALCWAYSAMSAAETSCIKKGITNINVTDFDEKHLAYFVSHTPVDVLGLTRGDKNIVSGVDAGGIDDTYLDASGNAGVGMMALANWVGASNEGTLNLSDLSVQNISASAMAYTKDAAHLENGEILHLPDMTASNYQADMTAVKNNIMSKGSMVVEYADYNSYAQNGYYYCPIPYSVNHAVTVVGWDDSIPASAFGDTPEGNGAWIVKNSWGDYEGSVNGGYFYLSYYDKSLSGNAYFFDFGSKDNYDNNYQYDGTSNFSGFSTYSTDKIYGANVFTADSAEKLKAVGITTKNTNVNYTIEIYKGFADGANPTTGSCVSTTSGIANYYGYHTIPLSTEVPLAAGEKYAIVLTLQKPGESVYIGNDYSMDASWISFTSKAKQGQSYIGTSKERLKDMNEGAFSWTEGHNLRIKAFTDEIPFSLNGICYLLNSDSVSVGVDYSDSVSNLQFKWMAYNLDTGVWTQISDWSTGNWSGWKPEKGNYWLQAQARDAEGNTDQYTICFYADRDYSGKYLSLDGICYILNDTSVSVGTAYTSSDPNVQFKWMAYNLDTGVWEQISDWSTGNWSGWHPRRGNYWLQVQARNSYGVYQSYTMCFAAERDYIEKSLELKGICYIQNGDSVSVGVDYVTTRTDVQFQWLSYNLDTGAWTQITDWYPGNWAVWYPQKGNYWLVAQAKSGNDILESYTICYAVQ